MASLIVLSGLLVVLAIVFLGIGLIFSEGLGWVYASIGTSVVAGVLLLLGAMQRRGETPGLAGEGTGVSGGDDAYDRISAVSVTRPAETAGTAATTATETADTAFASSSGGRTVAVVPGRPRYHVESCRFLAGRSDVTQVALEQARADGYSACGVCRPDEAADTAPATTPDLPAVAAPEEVLAGEEPTTEEAAAPTRRRTAAATATRATTSRTTGASRAATKAPAKTAAKAAPAKAATATRATAAKAAGGVAAAAEKPAKAAGAQKVVVIPDRGKFHKDGCRFVRDVAGTVTLSKPQAQKQGFVPCGVCKP